MATDSESNMQTVSTTRGNREWRLYNRKSRLKRYGAIAVLTAIFVFAWQELDIAYQYFASAPVEMNDLFQRSYPPNWGYSLEIIGPTIESLNMAIIGTIFATLFALPVAFMAAENTTPNRFTYWLGKTIVTVSRSVNTIIYALIFVVVFGPGVLAGTMAIIARSIGSIGKLIGEEIEEIDPGQVEAIRATGAGTAAILAFGIVPQIKVFFVTITTYNWDGNVRGSTILGFVGAGGIGMPLFASINQFRWQSAAMVLVMILVIVIFSEVVSAYTRRKVREI